MSTKAADFEDAEETGKFTKQNNLYKEVWYNENNWFYCYFYRDGFFIDYFKYSGFISSAIKSLFLVCKSLFSLFFHSSSVVL